jgi:hypothetical protein
MKKQELTIEWKYADSMTELQELLVEMGYTPNEFEDLCGIPLTEFIGREFQVVFDRIYFKDQME